MSHAQNIPLRPNGPHHIHYGWTIAGVTFATLLIGGLIRSPVAHSQATAGPIVPSRLS